MKKCKRGFTLIELLVVISIISLMSSIVLAALNDARQRARDTAIKESFLNLNTNIANYYTGNLNYSGMCDVGSVVREQVERINSAFGINPSIYGNGAPGENEHTYNCIGESDYLIYIKLASGSYACMDSSGGRYVVKAEIGDGICGGN